jgi:prepilin signal peptidase PulO-like enzyme (type II secretory pathway)
MSETPLLWVFVALVGLVFGSFATLVSHRLVEGGAIAFARSRCPQCRAALGVRDLIPVCSWLWARGRCRHCAAPVHWRYPAIELATAALFLLVFLRTGLTPEFLPLAGFALCLVIMSVTDFEHRILPDAMQWAAAALGVWFHLAMRGTTPVELGTGLFCGFFLGALLQKGYKYLRGRDGLGTGDVKFLAVAGIWLGAAGLPPLMLFSGILGILTAILWRISGRGEYFPFGPALIGATFLLALFPELPAGFYTFFR